MDVADVRIFDITSVYSIVIRYRKCMRKWSRSLPIINVILIKNVRSVSTFR